MARTVSPYILGTERKAGDKALDASAVAAIAQAAVNVELFTIPLYMGTLYSIWGMHQITGDNDFYTHRLWPGPATSAKPGTANEKAFNLIYSVFIEEMLHLQMAANIATAIGVTPDFTSTALQHDLAWTCYGDLRDDETVIPNIVDLRDTKSYADVRVHIGPLDSNQIKLFLAIEQPEDVARRELGADPDADIPVATGSNGGDYFPTVPFETWNPASRFNRLPMFGSIGWMYQCYYDYLNLRYDDGSTLWDFVSVSRQKDLFNAVARGHVPEYPGFAAALPSSQDALADVVDMMDAITDQGEGSELKKRAPNVLSDVQPRYRASREALDKDYPKYDDAGHEVPSSDAVARTEHGSLDHYQRFEEVAGLLHEVETWPAWFASRGSSPWRAEDLETAHADPHVDPYDLPSTQAIAAALNRVGADPGTWRETVNEAVTGSIGGVTTVLNQYWTAVDGSFPYPSMAGSGDRMAIYWALFGEAPRLWEPPPKVDEKQLNHACQALNLTTPGASCAVRGIFHSCRGSNACKTQGGCGFVQKTTGGGQGCSPHVKGPRVAIVLAPGGDDDLLFSSPGDNKCAGLGGCAAPISASQLMPDVKDASGKVVSPVTLQLFDFNEDNEATPIGTITCKKGDKVHDIAYAAYFAVMSHRGMNISPHPPEPNDLRLVFSPST